MSSPHLLLLLPGGIDSGPNQILTEDGFVLTTESGEPILYETATQRFAPAWPWYQKPGPGALINREHPLARALTRCHLFGAWPYQAASGFAGPHDFVHGPRRKMAQHTASVSHRNVRMPVGAAWAIPVQATEAEHGANDVLLPNSASENHGDWDAEENGLYPRAPFTVAVLFESTDVQAANRWPCIMLCQNIGGTRAGFEIALYNALTSNW